MITSRSLLLFLFASSLAAQPCAVSPPQSFPLPAGTGTTPVSHEIIAPQGGGYLYLPTQWGVVRGSIAGHPATPGPFQMLGVGQVSGFPGGVIPIRCDCFAAWRAFDAAESGGVARLIGGWQPYDQGGGLPPGPLFSGLPAQVTKSAAVGQAFGQQINLPGSVPVGARSAVLATSAGKWYGYFPTAGGSVVYADLSSPTGSPDPNQAILSLASVPWVSSGAGVRLTAGYDLLAGATPDSKLHIATVDPQTGIASETAATPMSALPGNLEIARVANRTYVFAAEDLAGLRVYEYVTALTGPSLIYRASVPGRAKLVQVKGGGQYPYLLVHRLEPGGNSYIDVYGTTWLPALGQPVLGASLQTLGINNPKYLAYGFDAAVDDAAPAAYVYREAVTTPEQSMTVAKVTLGCLSGGAPPTPSPTPAPVADPFAAWVEQLAREGVTAGCGNGNFCPDAPLTREQAAVWLLKSKHGGDYVPPPCVGMFNDVPCGPVTTRIGR